MLKAVWVEWIQQNIINAHLPWPRYARDFTIVPSKLLEALAIRTYFFDKNWGRWNPRPRSIIDIQRPAGTISWLSLFRTEWVLAASVDGWLRIWSIKYPSRSPIEWKSPSSWIAAALLDSNPTELDSPFQLIAAFKYDPHVLSHSFSLTRALFSDNKARVIHISNFNGIQAEARFEINAEFDGYYNLLASRGSSIAFGADVERYEAHVVDISGGAARLALGSGVTRVSLSASIHRSL